jgi:hypothetical protein
MIERPHQKWWGFFMSTRITEFTRWGSGGYCLAKTTYDICQTILSGAQGENDP